MYRTGWKTKVHGSRNHRKPPVCAKGTRLSKFMSQSFLTRLWFQHSFVSVPTFRVWERRRMTSAARRQATLEAVGWIAAFPTSPSSSQSWKTFMFCWIWTILEENINVWNDPFFFFFLVLSQCTVNKNSFLSVFIYQCLVDMPLHHLWSYEIKILDFFVQMNYIWILVFIATPQNK